MAGAGEGHRGVRGASFAGRLGSRVPSPPDAPGPRTPAGRPARLSLLSRPEAPRGSGGSKRRALEGAGRSRRRRRRGGSRGGPPPLGLQPDGAAGGSGEGRRQQQGRRTSPPPPKAEGRGRGLGAPSPSGHSLSPAPSLSQPGCSGRRAGRHGGGRPEEAAAAAGGSSLKGRDGRRTRQAAAGQPGCFSSTRMSLGIATSVIHNLLFSTMVMSGKGSSSISSDVSSSTDYTPTKTQKNAATSEGRSEGEPGSGRFKAATAWDRES
ncbi:collagen alpha-1(I) chain-like [Sphaerodactylus townsendi]|uniref:collagen alpha-1(I) chain-like n=1 Tax=Sphaerodactylus townsendi TaxID=933632 RepID=UPI0020268554|nr:collagen alpha-1(I) chain-like [Sphaerodactylus townsendi]